MLAMIRRLFGLSQPEPPPHTRSIARRLDSFCLNTPGSHTAIAAASQFRQSADDSAPSTCARAPVAAAPAPRGPPPATGNQAADWLEMRRTAGWQTLEGKPDGRHLFLSTDELDRLARQSSNPGSEVVEAPLVASVGPAPHDGTTNNFPSATPPENVWTVTGEGSIDNTASTALHPTAPPHILVDRRAARRYSASQVHGQLKIVESSSKSTALLRDISTIGVSLVLGAQHRVNTSLQLTITSNSYGIVGPVQTKVVRLVHLANGRWLTCCVFDTPLDHEWLKTLIRNG
jgi:hypothetical protein